MCTCLLGGMHLCYGYCATSQGLLDWFEVDLRARPASLLRVICELSIFIILYACGSIVMMTAGALTHTATHCNASALTYNATQCYTLQHIATHCNNINGYDDCECPHVHCNTLHYIATHCSTLQQDPLL